MTHNGKRAHRRRHLHLIGADEQPTQEAPPEAPPLPDLPVEPPAPPRAEPYVTEPQGEFQPPWARAPWGAVLAVILLLAAAVVIGKACHMLGSVR